MIALVNPRSAHWGFRVPNSLLTLGAFLEGRYDYTIIDENLGVNAVNELAKLIPGGVKYIGITVMPALQLRGAYQISMEIKTRFPDVKIIWGGYFPSMHPNTVLRSPYIDYVLKGHAEYSFTELLDSLEAKPGAKELNRIAGLSYKSGENITHNQKAEPIAPDLIPRLPYHRVDVDKYLNFGKTYLGPRTIGYHSSVGCPFLCGFCAVAGIYKGKWLGRSAELTASDIIFLKEKYNIGAVEFHDNNFFVAEKRVYDFAKAVNGLGIGWWGEARPDTVMKFSDDTWQMMADAGCKMIFYGAETSNDELLKLMHKGGTQNAQTLLDLAEKSKKYGIVPELSFVLGNPTDNVTRDIEEDLKFIKKIKAINPAAEIVIYTYSPVNFEDSEMSLAAKLKGFDYPKSLEEWVSPKWQNFDLRKNPLTPWLKPQHFKMIRNFEKTLNAYYPTNSDLKIRGWKRSLLQFMGSWRYKTDFYNAPYEIMLTQKLLKYRQPEIEGFAQS
ncbi:MAG TPA: radical SAM protein [Ignavibacteria bacterium]|nr:radical SAM protein [Bacteroidota bacterium]HRE12441.1 radical SAM protein [Ignavibacteria bacterium]HRF67549.1 radical SAM protein [Ignavibacteria bacterium]HRJ05858.1 radical SAM protein [Ignavibacteria bacterium]HRJ86635.1 radical SAM protein [Ignavibacteria bacterium]